MTDKEKLALTLLEYRLTEALANVSIPDALRVIQQWAEDNNAVHDLLDLWERE